MRRLLILSIGVLAGALVFLLAFVASRTLGGQPAQSLDDLGPAPAFALTDQLERAVSSDEFRGRVIVADFVYTSCRDICPMLSARMRDLQERLRQEELLGSQVQLLSFTVDPAIDTPAVLGAYGERFGADPDAWRFLTGPERTLVPLIVDGFHLGRQVLPPKPGEQPGNGVGLDAHTTYEIAHGGQFILIDPRGRVRAYYDGRAFDLEQVVRDIRQVLP
jgi:protein SCO1/2